MYQTLFTLPENLYTAGSPVLIEDGVLQLDTAENQTVVQLTLRNIGVKPIKAASVIFYPRDVANRPLAQPLSYQYLDFTAPRGGSFGRDAALALPDSTARAFHAVVTEVVFTDNTVWTSAPSAEWTPLPAQPSLLQAFNGDAELVKQYQLRHGGDAAFLPGRERDLWRCACRAVNRADEPVCYVCGKQIDKLLATDMDALRNARDTRLKEEKAASEAAAKKTKKMLKIVLPVLAAAIALFFLLTKVILPSSQYNKAVKLMEAGKYDEAITMFQALDGYKDSEERIAEAETEQAVAAAEALEKDGKTAEAAMAFYALRDADPAFRERSFALWNKTAHRETLFAVWLQTIGLRTDGTVVATGDNRYGQCDISGWTDVVALATNSDCTVGLRADGTVVATGENRYGECDVSGWTDIVAVAAGTWHTVGLRSDGTVVATGDNRDGQCDVSEWTDIVAISSRSHTVGLRADGTVVAAGYNKYGQCDVSEWTDIVAIYTGSAYTVGLHSDGTVVATGDNRDGQCDVSGWTNIVAICTSGAQTIGLRADGTVVATGNNKEGQCDVSEWTDIVAISTYAMHTVGLRSDGTVVATGYNEQGQCDVSDWTDVVAICVGTYHTVGLRADGTVIATGYNNEDQCNVSGWTDIKLPDSK